MIDVIIPLFNSKSTLERCLKSIYKQLNKDDLNIYIIDDASTDNYDEILNKYSKLINIKYYKLNRNFGPGYAREYGIEQSNSPYIIFIDSDDMFYSEDSLTLLLNKIKKGYDVVNSKFLKQNEDLKTYKRYFNDYINLHGKIFRRDFIKKNKIKFLYTYGEEDNAFNHLILLYEPKIFILDKITYVNMFNCLSLTSKNNKEYFSDFLYYYSKAFLYCLEEGIKNNCNKYLIAYWAFNSNLVIYSKLYYDKYKINNDELLKVIKSLAKIYKEYEIYLDDRSKLKNVNIEIFEYNISGFLSTNISFNEYIDRMINNIE